MLDAEDQSLLAGWIVNKFRGDLGLLRPGLDTLARTTGRPVLGVLPWLDGAWIDSEDALAVAGRQREAGADRDSARGLRVAVVRLPRTSNATDVDAIAAEPGVSVSLTADPDIVRTSDIVVLPGTRATVDDLQWMRERGIDRAVADRAREGLPVLGICGGHQMLASVIDDPWESKAGTCEGLGLLPTAVTFGESKTLGTPTGMWRGREVAAYEIHHGSVALDVRDGRAQQVEEFLDGWRFGSVWGTTWHGAFDNDGFRRAWLVEAAAQSGHTWRPDHGAPGFAQLRESMLDRLACAVAEHLDTAALLRVITQGAPEGMPFIPPGGTA